MRLHVLLIPALLLGAGCPGPGDHSSSSQTTPSPVTSSTATATEAGAVHSAGAAGAGATSPAGWSAQAARIADDFALLLSRAEANDHAGAMDAWNKAYYIDYETPPWNLELETARHLPPERSGRREVSRKQLRESAFSDLRHLVHVAAPIAQVRALIEDLAGKIADDAKALDALGVPPEPVVARDPGRKPTPFPVNTLATAKEGDWAAYQVLYDVNHEVHPDEPDVHRAVTLAIEKVQGDLVTVRKERETSTLHRSVPTFEEFLNLQPDRMILSDLSIADEDVRVGDRVFSCKRASFKVTTAQDVSHFTFWFSPEPSGLGLVQLDSTMSGVEVLSAHLRMTLAGFGGKGTIAWGKTAEQLGR